MSAVGHKDEHKDDSGFLKKGSPLGERISHL